MTSQFYRPHPTAPGLVTIHEADGSAATRCPGLWPLIETEDGAWVSSGLSGRYEHADGIVCSVADAQAAGVARED